MNYQKTPHYETTFILTMTSQPHKQISEQSTLKNKFN